MNLFSLKILKKMIGGLFFVTVDFIRKIPNEFISDRAISNQICDVRTKFDILYAFVNVSLCLTHRKHSIQRALDSPGSGERFKYVEHARKVYI